MSSKQQTQRESVPDVTPHKPAQGQDLEPMQEAEGKPSIALLPGALETAASFQFEGEDHTLGNALRYVIMKNPQVEFCAYTIPHPSEPKMNLRIQTYDSTDVFEVLEKGLDDLKDLCDVVMEKFTAAKAEFEMNKTT